MSNYEFNKDLKKYSKLNIPINKFSLKIINGFLNKKFKAVVSTNKVEVSHIKIKAQDNYEIPAILFEPIIKTNRAMLFLHGSGFTVKTSTFYYDMIFSMATALKCKILLPEYRLCPKNNMYTITQDAKDSYDYLVNNSNNLNIDKDKIIIFGDSAGANLACEVALDDRKPLMMLLVYPVIDNNDDYESKKIYFDTPIWNSKLNKQMWNWYLHGVYGYKPVNKRSNLRELQNVYIEVAEYDCLNNEGESFAKKLEDLGIETTFVETKNAMHGYDIAIGTKFIENVYKKRYKFIESVFEKTRE